MNFDECIVSEKVFEMIKSNSVKGNTDMIYDMKVRTSIFIPEHLIAFVKDKKIVNVIDLRKYNNKKGGYIEKRITRKSLC